MYHFLLITNKLQLAKFIILNYYLIFMNFIEMLKKINVKRNLYKKNFNQK